MPLIPHRFLFRIAYPCRYVKDMPREQDDGLVELPESCRIDNFAGLDEKRNFADVRLAWNELGLGLQVEVRGKEQLPQGDAARPRGSDGLTLWIDTRQARGSHRASRYCHQFHFLPTGGGPEREEPVFAQTKINRALQDAPLCAPGAVPFRSTPRKGGYRLEAFLPAAVLNGFDPEQNPRLGFFYAVRDAELGEQLLSADSDFPYWEDPSLWSVLELVR
ncbi:MAG TPA: hypothetical protein VNK04_02095 [Gemmataceae bacterium]|nr:hypothetical protein [Gemmataceae bacterium]